MAKASGRRERQRGQIEALPSGSLRVKVYAGRDQLTKTKLFLTEVVKPGPRQARLAEQALTKLLNDVDERRNPRTRATLGQLMTRYFEVLDVETKTLAEYRSKYRRHVEPFLGSMPLAKLMDVEPIDSLYAELRRCSKHCRKGRKLVDHRTETLGHACDEHRGVPCQPPNPDGCRACKRACRPHVCTPLSDSTVRHIHWILSGALGRAAKWKWISSNPAEKAAKPPTPKPDPRAPTAEEAALLINAAYAIDVNWGEFIFSKATTGNRRSEHCALQWKHFADPKPDEESAVLLVDQALYKAKDGGLKIKDTKTHQQRRTVLDPDSTLLFRDRLNRKKAEAANLGIRLSPNAFIFSPVPDGSEPLKPDTATQKFARMTRRLGIDADLKNWRHYNATELIAAGVDLNIVAGRLGHGGGGATTLKSYTVYQDERSQRAADALVLRMPARPNRAANGQGTGDARVLSFPGVSSADTQQPYQRIANDLRGAISSGFVSPGDPLPTMKDLATRYGVALSTAHRAVALLVEQGLVIASRGVRARVGDPCDSGSRPEIG